jgi:hypothetical protein
MLISLMSTIVIILMVKKVGECIMKEIEVKEVRIKDDKRRE